MNEFKNYHPFVLFFYFFAVIAFSMFLLNPVCVAISLFSSLAYALILGGKKTLKFSLLCILPIVLISAVVNPLFNHRGVTILRYFPNGNPLTLESILYGIISSSMLASVIFFFSCVNKIMTSDKIVYLFGKITPHLALLISMTLRFVPRFKKTISDISLSQKALGGNEDKKGIFKNLKNSVKILLAAISLTFENAVETSDSMKSRGYGSGKRTSFSNIVFEKRDAFALAFLIISSVCILTACVFKILSFSCFPYLSKISFDFLNTSVYVLYFLLCAFPIFAGIKGEIMWKKSK